MTVRLINVWSLVKVEKAYCSFVKNWRLVPLSLISKSEAISISCSGVTVDLNESSFREASGSCISFVSIQGLAAVNWIEERFHVEQAWIWIFYIELLTIPRPGSRENSPSWLRQWNVPLNLRDFWAKGLTLDILSALFRGATLNPTHKSRH